MQVTPPLFIAMYILMGVAPLSAWGVTSLRRLGRSLIVPLVLTASRWSSPTCSARTAARRVIRLRRRPARRVRRHLRDLSRGGGAHAQHRRESLPRALVSLFARNRRRYGGFIVHLGITVIGIGVIGSTLFQLQTQQTLSVGQSLTLGQYTMTYNGMLAGQIADDNRVMDIAQVTVVDHNSGVSGHIRPRHDFYPQSSSGMNQMNIAGSYSTIEGDFYVLLSGWDQPDGATATFKIYVNPLINMIWWGGLILILGTVISVGPAERLPASVRERRIVTKHAGALA